MKWRTIILVLAMFGNPPLRSAQSGIDFLTLAQDQRNGVWIGGSVFDAEAFMLNSRADRVRAGTVSAAPFIADVSFANSRMGWVVGGGFLYKTIDAGRTWRKINYGSDSWRLNSVAFVDQRKGWAAGDGGLILVTENGGLTWKKQANDSPFTIQRIRFVNHSFGWALGSDIRPPETRRVLLLTTDGGLTWRKAPGSDDQQFRNVFFLKATQGWAINQDDEILHTIDGGETWNVQRKANGKWNSVFFASHSEGWAVGDGILHTYNGGETWEYQLKTDGSSSEYLENVLFVNAQEGWVISLFRVLVTHDGGVTWRSLTDSWKTDIAARVRREKLKPTVFK